MTAKDILFIVAIPLALAEVGPWCGWVAERLLPWAARLRYGDTDRAAVRLEEWSGDLGDIPGQLTKLAYAVGQLATGTAASARRRAKSVRRKTRALSAGNSITVVEVPAGAGRRAAILDALRNLPSSQHKVLVYRFYEQWSEDEIASAMGISRQAVRLHTVQGISALRAMVIAPPNDLD